MLEYCNVVINKELLKELMQLRHKLTSRRVNNLLSPLISKEEITSLGYRIDHMLNDPKLPILDPYQNVPLPLA